MVVVVVVCVCVCVCVCAFFWGGGGEESRDVANHMHRYTLTSKQMLSNTKMEPTFLFLARTSFVRQVAVCCQTDSCADVRHWHARPK